MAEFEIFSHYVDNSSEYDSLFVKLSSEVETPIAGIQLIRMELAEVFSSGSPVMTLEFTDLNGDFINHYKPNPSTKYFLDIGRGLLKATRTELRCSKVVMLNQRAGSAEQIAFKMFFIHHGWNEMINIRKSRGWNDKKTSEIITEIANECGFSKVEVAETSTAHEFFIQPYWSNLQTIRHLRKKAKTEAGGYVEFGVKLTGEFFFKSVGDMIQESKVKAKNKKLTTFKMQGQFLEDANREAGYKANNDAPTYFAHFTGEENYIDSVVNGGGGIKSMYFDSGTGKYVETVVTYTNTETPQMSDWGAIQKTHEVSEMRMYGGRDSDVVIEAEGRVIDTVDSTSRLEIVLEGTPSVHIGEMVEIIIPMPNINSTLPQSIIYSGFYLVCGVRHSVNFNTSVMNTTISLMREGFDGKALTGYSKSKAGKFL
jgi:hypothetical protein